MVRWLKSVGDTVTLGEPLAEVETEKSVVEIEATASGRLTEILVQIDQEAAVGDRIAWIESDQAPASTAPLAKPPSDAPEAARPSPAAVEARAGERIRSSPAARKLAAGHGLDLDTVTGSGPRGRVQLDDVRRAIEAPARKAAPRIAVPTVHELSPMRRALARAMTLSNATIPQFTVERSVDWSVLQAQRAEFSAKLAPGSPRLSVNDFLLQAVARALIEVPALNATFSGDAESPDARVVQASGAHIGLVIAVENGLLVPVFHDVERLGLAELARRRLDCVERGLMGTPEARGGRRRDLQHLEPRGAGTGPLHGDHQPAAVRDSRRRPAARLRRAEERTDRCASAVAAHADGRSPRSPTAAWRRSSWRAWLRYSRPATGGWISLRRPLAVSDAP